MRRSPFVLAAAAFALALGGCTSGGSPQATSSHATSSRSAAGSGTTSPGPTTTSRVPVVPPAPEKDACYQLTMTQLTRPTNQSDPVSCAQRHDAQTIYVGTLDTVVDGHALAVDSDRVQHQLATVCPRRFADYLGGSGEDRRLSRFRVVWFSPTLAQADQGARWFRCDVVAFARGDSLYGLPAPRRMHRALARPNALATYGLCGTAAPGAPDFERVICDLKHSWVAISTIDLAGGRKYPGEASVRQAGDTACRDQVHARNPGSLTYRYGWEWPTREQWATGQHYGYCWAPS